MRRHVPTSPTSSSSNKKRPSPIVFQTYRKATTSSHGHGHGGPGGRFKFKTVHLIGCISIILVNIYLYMGYSLIAKSNTSTAGSTDQQQQQLKKKQQSISQQQQQQQQEKEPPKNQKKLRPLQKIAAQADSIGYPKNYNPRTAKTYDVPKEDEIPFVDFDIDDTIQEQVKKFVKARPDLYQGREHLLGMLLEMKDIFEIPMNSTNNDIYHTAVGVDETTWQKVPLWNIIQQNHGTHPVIYGLEQCRAFRETVPPTKRHVMIAGMFNTGTNLLAILLQHNCGIPEQIDQMGRKKGHGMEWQTPYGKHTPIWLGIPNNHNEQHFHVTSALGKIPFENIMVGVMIRHPYDWILSMCRHAYSADWKHTKTKCPNLLNNSTHKYNAVRAHFGAGYSYHDSIAHMWNDWYGGYYYYRYNTTTILPKFPRLMIRFEDVIFYPKQLSRLVCGCVGGQLYVPKENDSIFHYVIDSAKTGGGHGPDQKRNGLVDAWIKYGVQRNFSSVSPSDMEQMEQIIDPKMKRTFHW